MADEDKAKIGKARNVLKNLPERDRREFVQNFNRLDSEEKRGIALDRLVSSASGEKAGTPAVAQPTQQVQQPAQAPSQFSKQDMLRTLLSGVSGASSGFDVGERGQTAAIAGLPAAAAGIKPEAAARGSADILPALGQTVGGLAGGFPGAVAGGAAGQAGRQAVTAVLDKRTDIGAMGKAVAADAATTAIFEGLTRIPASMLFRIPRAEQMLTKIAGPALGKIKEAVSNISDADPLFGANRAVVIKFIQTRMSKLIDTSGRTGATLRKFLKDFEKIKTPVIPARKLIEFESVLGESLQDVFGTVSKRTLNKVGSQVRTFVSGQVDNLAEKAGFSSFKVLSAQVSKARTVTGKGVPRTTQQAIAKAFTELGPRIGMSSVAGASAFAATQSPLAAGVAGALPFMAASPNVQRVLFNLIEKSGAGRAATVAGTEVARKAIGQ